MAVCDYLAIFLLVRSARDGTMMTMSPNALSRQGRHRHQSVLYLLSYENDRSYDVKQEKIKKVTPPPKAKTKQNKQKINFNKTLKNKKSFKNNKSCAKKEARIVQYLIIDYATLVQIGTNIWNCVGLKFFPYL